MIKKIIIYSFLIMFALSPFTADAQTTSGLCTGEIRTNIAAAQDCIAKATAQGEALGYEMSCKVEQLGLGGFVDPTSNLNYILNATCTVNGSTGHSAQLLVGWVAAPGSTAMIQNINPGWNILKTELAYESAFTQCGGKAPYASVVNGVNVYSCSAPAGALPATAPTGTTKTTDSFGTDVSVRASTALLNTLNSLYANLLSTYKNTYGIDLQGLLTGTAKVTPSSSSGQCYVFGTNLQVGATGADVIALTYVLKQAGLLTQTSSVFDTTVMTAVKRFQEMHATEILSILGLTQGTGLVGEKTRTYLNSNCSAPASAATAVPPSAPAAPTASCLAPLRSGIKNGKYVYMFKQNTDSTWTVTLTNLAYSTPSDPYYVPAFFSFTATNALDLNRQNQGKFNYLQALPGTAAGNTEYANLFGSFNNAYYDWNEMTKPAATCN